jgi:hypothetical protein
MIKSFLIQPLIKRYNIRTKCDLNCKEKYVNLISQQTESLEKIYKHTQIITFITIANFMAPVVFIGAACLINKIMN